MRGLALLYCGRRQYAQAEPLVTKVVEVAPRVLGPTHPTTLHYVNDLALLYVNTGGYAQAAARCAKSPS